MVSELYVYGNLCVVRMKVNYYIFTISTIETDHSLRQIGTSPTPWFYVHSDMFSIVKSSTSH